MYLSLRERRPTEGPAGRSGRVAGHGAAAGRGEPAHRRVLGVGGGRAAAVPDRRPRPRARWPTASSTASTRGSAPWSGCSAGWLADRGDHPKWVAAGGYGLSALTRLALLAATGFARRDRRGHRRPARQGPAHRPARRDDRRRASDPATLGRAFGMHRALDTVGRGARSAARLRRAAGSCRTPTTRSSWSRSPSPSSGSRVLAARGAGPAAATGPARRATPSRRARSLGAAAARPAAGPAAASPPAVLGAADRRRRLPLPVAADSATTSATAWFPLLFVGTNLAYLRPGPPARPARRPGRAGPGLPRSATSLLLGVVPAPPPARSAGGARRCSACCCSAPTTRRPTASCRRSSGRLVARPTSGPAGSPPPRRSARWPGSRRRCCSALLWFTLGRTPALLVVGRGAGRRPAGARPGCCCGWTAPTATGDAA